MSVTISNLIRRKSGTTGNNLGGPMHADEISNNVVNNIWRKITETELQTGVTIFRGFYIYNDHSDEPLKNVILYFTIPATNSAVEISLGHGTSGINATSVEQTLASETSIPTVRQGKWYVNPGDRSDGLPIDGDIKKGEHAFVWMRMVVPSGTQSSVFTHYRMRVNMFNPESAANIPEDFSLIFAANMQCTTNNLTTYQNMTKRDFEFFQTCGNNNVGDSSMECFKNFLVVAGLRPKTRICLGYSDNELTKRNALKTEFAMNSEYYSYDVYNVHFTVMKFENTYNVGNAHYNWVKNDLETARQRPGIDWLVVVVNDNMYAPKYGGPDGDPLGTLPNPQSPQNSLRDVYHPLFMANSVHLVISGGANLSYKTYALKYNSDNPNSPIPVQTDQANVGNVNYTWFNKGLEDGASLFISVGTIGMDAFEIFEQPGTGSYIESGNFTQPIRSYMVVHMANFGTKMNILVYSAITDSLGPRSSIEKVLPP